MSQTDHRCPVCGVGLFLGQASDVSMLGCGKCGGQWLDNAGTKRVVDGILSRQARTMAQEVSTRGKAAEGGHYRKGTDEPARRCPICDGATRSSTVPPVNIEIDVCPAHGTWFDAHELDALAKHYELQAAITDAEAGLEVAALDEAAARERRSFWGRSLLDIIVRGS